MQIYKFLIYSIVASTLSTRYCSSLLSFEFQIGRGISFKSGFFPGHVHCFWSIAIIWAVLVESWNYSAYQLSLLWEETKLPGENPQLSVQRGALIHWLHLWRKSKRQIKARILLVKDACSRDCIILLFTWYYSHDTIHICKLKVTAWRQLCYVFL